MKVFVNENQHPLPAHFRVADYYKTVTADFALYLKTIVLPESCATIYVVCVPQDNAYSTIVSYFVPPIDKLIHNPEGFGFSEELDQQRRMEVPRYFTAWKEHYTGENELVIAYLHIHTLGIIPERRSSRWMTFGSLEDAERYRDWVIQNPQERSEVSKALSEAFEKLVDDWTYDLYYND